MKINKRKTILIIISVLTVILISIVSVSCMGMGSFSNNNNQSSTQSQGMETYTVVRGNILQEATTTGSVDVKTTNTYTFEVTGKVISALEQGDTFKKGEVLTELDNSDGVAKINDLEGSLQTAEDSLATSKSSLTTAKINYQKALDANHIAIQLAKINTEKSEESTASALASLESANMSAELSYESASAALENTTNTASWTITSAKSALDEAERILEEAKNDSATTASELAKYEYNVKSAEEKYELTKVQQQASIDSSNRTNESTENQNRSSIDSAQKSYEKSQLEQSSTYWNNLSSLQSAEAQIKLVQLNISDAGLKLKQAERSVESSKQDIEDAKQDLNDYRILAPYDGIISSTGYKVGEQSGQGGTGISIISNEFIIKATISENDMPKVKVGNEVVISLDAYSDVELNGTLEKINPVSTTTNGIVSYGVLISFQDVKDVELFYGLSANVSIIIAKAENVLYVPLQSVYKENGKSYVDVLKTAQANQQNQTIEKVEVTTGINDYVNIEIKSGINEGDVIVTSKVTQ